MTLLVLLLSAVGSAHAQYNKDYFYWESRRLMMDGQYVEAIQTLGTLLRYEKDAAEGYFLRGVSKFNLDDLIGADVDFTTAIDKNPVYTLAYAYRALTRSRMGNYDDALRDFQEAIDLRPDLPDAYYSRGFTLLQDKQYRAAIADFDKYIFRENKTADAYIGRGAAYLSLKDTVRAFEDFDRAIRTNRENPTGYYHRGTLHLQREDWSAAECDFDMSIRCDSTFIPSWLNRAVVYSNTHRPMQAISDLDRVLQLDSISSLALFNRALLRSQIGDYNRALEDFDRVARYSPENVQVYYLRALLKNQLGDLKGAESDYTRAIELYPDFANAYLNRSVLRYARRRPDLGRSDEEHGRRLLTEYRNNLRDSTWLYADSARMHRLLSFETEGFERAASEQRMQLLPLVSHDTVQTRQYADRIVELSAAIVRHPSAELYFKRGVARAAMIDFVAGLENPYQRITVDTDPANQLYGGAARGYDYSEAEADFSTAIERSPDLAEAWYNRGVLLARAGRLADAFEDFSRAIAIDPRFAEAWYNRGMVQIQMKDTRKGCLDLSKAGELGIASAYETLKKLTVEKE